MYFDVPAESYGRFMGRYSGPLAEVFADFADVTAPARALDVGCGTGALTDVLVRRLGAGNVSALDPSESFVRALAERQPAVEVLHASAESLPYADGTFTRTLAQLVVHFMRDPVAGLAEMARVTRAGGVVAANVWDQGSGRGPLGVFWRAARDLDPGAVDESGLAGGHQGALLALFGAAGMAGARPTLQSVHVTHPSFEEWWEPFTLGVGPAGEHVRRLSVDEREELRQRCRQLLPPAPFVIEAAAWTVAWTRD